jgi:hypothetical protein
MVVKIMTNGYIYIFRQNENSNQYKIGWSKNPSKRIQTHFGSNPNLQYIDMFPAIKNNVADDEKRIHEYLEELRVHGTKETFYLEIEDLKHVRSILRNENKIYPSRKIKINRVPKNWK